jgi:hypothetical protein
MAMLDGRGWFWLSRRYRDPRAAYFALTIEDLRAPVFPATLPKMGLVADHSL